MLYYDLGLDEEALAELASSYDIYSAIVELIPNNLDKRILNNTVYFYYDAVSRVPGLSNVRIQEIRLDYMRNHQRALYGDMTEFISIPAFEGGKRVEIRNVDPTIRAAVSRNRRRVKEIV